MTPDQLTEQTIATFAAWKKDPKTPIQAFEDGKWSECENPAFLRHYEYRIAPFILTNSINGHTLADGQEWHRSDFTREDLPEGFRPLMLGEKKENGDEVWSFNTGPWDTKFCLADGQAAKDNHKLRTTRPLPSVAPKTRAWDRASDVPWPWPIVGEGGVCGAQILALDKKGFAVVAGEPGTAYLRFVTWQELKTENLHLHWTQDGGKSWHPCTVPA